MLNNKFHIGDIIVTKSRVSSQIVTPNGVKKIGYPWEIGRVVYVHPKHDFLTYSNGLFSTSAWLTECYHLADFRSRHSLSSPDVRNHGII